MTWLFSKIGFSGLQFYLTAALIAAASAGSAWASWEVRAGIAARAELAGVEAARDETARQVAIAADAGKIGQQITYDYGMLFAKNQTTIAARTAALQREAPRYVTPAADAAAAVPVGFVRFFDAAAAGAADPSALPIAPGQSDDAASDVKLSEIAAVSAANDDACHQNAGRLVALQGYVVAVKAWADNLYTALRQR